jgi:hypothetical protein
MRFKEFSDVAVRLNELKMAPSSLKKMAATIKGLCGIEFELYVPDIDTGDDEYDNDYDNNPLCYSIDGIAEFYSENAANDSYILNSAVEELRNKYYEYAREIMDDNFHNESPTLVREYIKDYDWDEDDQFQEAYEEMKLDDEEIAAVERWRAGEQTEEDNFNKLKSYTHFKRSQERVKEMLDEKTEESIDDADDNYQGAKEYWEENEEWPDEEDFLRSDGMRRMADLEDGYGLNWPFQSGGGSTDIHQLASDFEDAIGRPTSGCDEGYHGCQDLKGGDNYVIETDSSLSDAKSGFSGIEIVAPTLPLGEMVDEIKEVIAWAKHYGCYTDYHCGLHVNISIEDIPMEQLDYVKMALFVGDQYVLKEFNRQASTYAKSAFKQLQAQINYSPSVAYEVLNTLQQNLASVAGKLIHTGTTEKMVSLNAQEGRLEVRSPGGDWMNEDISKLESMVYRFIVALDIACDPEKNKEEYATKMYKFLNPGDTKNNSADAFAKYNAGIINRESLKQELMTKTTKTLPTVPMNVKPYDNSWEVTASNGQRTVVQADSAMAAVNAARAQLKLNSVQFPNNSFTAQPIPQADLFNQFATDTSAQSSPASQQEEPYQPSVRERIAAAKQEKAQQILPDF